MRLYEYEGKILFRRFKIPTLDGVVVDQNNLGELDKITYPVAIKAQVFAGGRGKAGFIQFGLDRNDTEQKVFALLGKHHGDFVINRVLIEKKVAIKKEFYLAITIDRLEHKPLFIASTKGGISVEEIAKTDAGSMIKFYFNIDEKPSEFMARKIAGKLGFSGEIMGNAASIILRLYQLFIGFDCKLVEINPWALTGDNQLIALDAKVDLDEDAMFRHPELITMGIVARHEVGELTPREKLAKTAGIPYVDLGGDIGVFPGGAGFGIAAIDLIKYYGGRPANFMDSGGAPTQEKLRVMLGLLIDNPGVKAIFGARFGGISRCDDWAKAVVQYIIENKPQKPMIMRMAGNMEEEGRRILEQAKKDYPELFKNIRIYTFSTPIEEVIQETIRIAKEIIIG